jgi:hypothetical protein
MPKRRDGNAEEDLLNTIISKIKTTKPRTPPPVPYFHALPCWAVETVSSARAKETRRRLRRSDWNIFAIPVDIQILERG